MRALEKFLIIGIVGTLLLCALSFNALSVQAGWSAENNYINYWVNPDADNEVTIYYLGTGYDVHAVQQDYSSTYTFELNVSNDNYENDVDLEWSIKGIVLGPNPTGDWNANGWAWFVGGGDTAWMTLDDGEGWKTWIYFNFQNETVFNARPFFPAQVQVQLELKNSDNDEVYWTPTLDWWVWLNPPENIEISCIADTYTDTNNASTNYGTGTTMESTGQYAANIKAAYAKFSLALTPSWGVQSATIRYYVSSTESPETRQIYQTTTDWEENTLTWNNQGTDATEVGGNLGTFPVSVGWNTMDVSDAVRSAVDDGDETISFKFKAITSGTSKQIIFRTKEYGDSSYAPQLIIESAPGGGEGPDFTMLGPYTGIKSGNKWTAILSGKVDNWNDESAANFTWYVRENPETPWKQWSHAAIGEPTTNFSKTTEAVFEESDYPWEHTYYIKLRGRGVYTNTTQDTDWLAVYIWENDFWTDGQPPGTPATITTIKADSEGTDRARLKYSLDIGGESWVKVWFHLSDDDNLETYQSIWVGQEITDRAIGAKLVEELTPNTTYYFEVYGETASGSKLYGGWLEFTTKETEVPKKPKIDISEWAHALGQAVGISDDAAGMILTLFVMGIVIFPLVLLKSKEPLGYLMLGSGVLAFSTYVQWTPGWFLLLIAMLAGLAIFSGWLRLKH